MIIVNLITFPDLVIQLATPHHGEAIRPVAVATSPLASTFGPSFVAARIPELKPCLSNDLLDRPQSPASEALG